MKSLLGSLDSAQFHGTYGGLAHGRNVEPIVPIASEFECHVGNVIVTVWLTGDLAKIADRSELPFGPPRVYSSQR